LHSAHISQPHLSGEIRILAEIFLDAAQGAVTNLPAQFQVCDAGNGKCVTVSNKAAATLIAQGGSIGTAESFGVQVIGGVPPATPGWLAAVSGNGQVGLNWAAASGATSYTLRRSTTYAGTYSVFASNLNSLSYTDANLADGAIYYYAVFMELKLRVKLRYRSLAGKNCRWRCGHPIYLRSVVARF
jgi:hypothetical protein